MDAQRTVADVEAMVRDNDRMRRTLERILQRAVDGLDDLPDGATVPHTLAAGHLLLVQGLARVALGDE